MDFEAGKQYKLRASRRVFEVVSVDGYAGTVKIKFLGERRNDEVEVSRSDLESAIHQDAQTAAVTQPNIDMSGFPFIALSTLTLPLWKDGPSAIEIQKEYNAFLNRRMRALTK